MYLEARNPFECQKALLTCTYTYVRGVLKAISLSHSLHSSNVCILNCNKERIQHI